MTSTRPGAQGRQLGRIGRGRVLMDSASCGLLAMYLESLRAESVRHLGSYEHDFGDARGLERLRRRYALLQTVPSDNVEFVCVYGFNTTLAHGRVPGPTKQAVPGPPGYVEVDCWERHREGGNNPATTQADRRA